MMNKGQKKLAFTAVVVFSLIWVHSLYASGLYVRDGARAPIRESPYESAKIMGMADSNDYLEIFESRNDWSRIKTPQGEEGWVSNRFLTRQMPKDLIISQLGEKIKSLTEENTTLQEQNNQLQKQSREHAYRISGQSKEVEDARKQYDRLREESSQYLDLKARHEALKVQFKTTSEKMETLDRENKKLKTSERLIFTLVGGGFIIIGLVIGTLLQFMKTKPKKGGYKF